MAAIGLHQPARGSSRRTFDRTLARQLRRVCAVSGYSMACLIKILLNGDIWPGQLCRNLMRLRQHKAVYVEAEVSLRLSNHIDAEERAVQELENRVRGQ